MTTNQGFLLFLKIGKNKKNNFKSKKKFYYVKLNRKLIFTPTLLFLKMKKIKKQKKKI